MPASASGPDRERKVDRDLAGDVLPCTHCCANTMIDPVNDPITTNIPMCVGRGAQSVRAP